MAGPAVSLSLPLQHLTDHSSSNTNGSLGINDNDSNMASSSNGCNYNTNASNNNTTFSNTVNSSSKIYCPHCDNNNNKKTPGNTDISDSSVNNTTDSGRGRSYSSNNNMSNMTDTHSNSVSNNDRSNSDKFCASLVSSGRSPLSSSSSVSSGVEWNINAACIPDLKSAQGTEDIEPPPASTRLHDVTLTKAEYPPFSHDPGHTTAAAQPGSLAVDEWCSSRHTWSYHVEKREFCTDPLSDLSSEESSHVSDPHPHLSNTPGTVFGTSDNCSYRNTLSPRTWLTSEAVSTPETSSRTITRTQCDTCAPAATHKQWAYGNSFSGLDGRQEDKYTNRHAYGLRGYNEDYVKLWAQRSSHFHYTYFPCGHDAVLDLVEREQGRTPSPGSEGVGLESRGEEAESFASGLATPIACQATPFTDITGVAHATDVGNRSKSVTGLFHVTLVEPITTTATTGTCVAESATSPATETSAVQSKKTISTEQQSLIFTTLSQSPLSTIPQAQLSITMPQSPLSTTIPQSPPQSLHQSPPQSPPTSPEALRPDKRRQLSEPNTLRLPTLHPLSQCRQEDKDIIDPHPSVTFDLPCSASLMSEPFQADDVLSSHPNNTPLSTPLRHLPRSNSSSTFSSAAPSSRDVWSMVDTQTDCLAGQSSSVLSTMSSSDTGQADARDMKVFDGQDTTHSSFERGATYSSPEQVIIPSANIDGDTTHLNSDRVSAHSYKDTTPCDRSSTQSDRSTAHSSYRRRRTLHTLTAVRGLTWGRSKSAFQRVCLTIPDPSNQKLTWTKPPLTVLIIRKHLDESVLFPFRDLVIWLVQEKNMVVYVERVVLEEGLLVEDERFQSVHDKLKSFREGVDDLTDKVDFIICLGGDGTLLYVSSLFQGSVPPVMAFNMGSLGFLTPFQFYEDFKKEVSKVMEGSASLLLRYRLKCVVVKHDTNCVTDIPHVKNIQKEHVSLKTHKLVLNEVVVDRGSSAYLSNLDLYIEGRRVTTVQGDGLIISTPTGSTAYAVAAGASMIHPSVPCILLTPICPHSLSFRPIVVPAGVEIKIMLSPGARGTAMVSFDGRDRLEIFQGDSLRITTASYPVPSICAADQIEDWFDGLAVCLNWNLRLHQRPLQATNSLTSIDSMDSDAMTSSQHSLINGQSEKSSAGSGPGLG